MSRIKVKERRKLPQYMLMPTSQLLAIRRELNYEMKEAIDEQIIQLTEKRKAIDCVLIQRLSVMSALDLLGMRALEYETMLTLAGILDMPNINEIGHSKVQTEIDYKLHKGIFSTVTHLLYFREDVRTNETVVSAILRSKMYVNDWVRKYNSIADKSSFRADCYKFLIESEEKPSNQFNNNVTPVMKEE